MIGIMAAAALTHFVAVISEKFMAILDRNMSGVGEELLVQLLTHRGMLSYLVAPVKGA